MINDVIVDISTRKYPRVGPGPGIDPDRTEASSPALRLPCVLMLLGNHAFMPWSAFCPQVIVSNSLPPVQ